jgi:RNA recognition motif-containing protein
VHAVRISRVRRGDAVIDGSPHLSAVAATAAEEGVREMAKKIYVGNMNYDTTEETLRQLFSAHGEVSSVSVVTDRYTGRAKGFGFVEMATDEAARAAIGALNGREVDGRQLRVNEANDRPRDSRGPGGGGGDRGGSRERRW